MGVHFTDVIEITVMAEAPVRRPADSLMLELTDVALSADIYKGQIRKGYMRRQKPAILAYLHLRQLLIFVQQAV